MISNQNCSFLRYFNHNSNWPILALYIRPTYVIAKTRKILHFRGRLKCTSPILLKPAYVWIVRFHVGLPICTYTLITMAVTKAAQKPWHFRLAEVLQLDWPSETDTLKINLPRDREGYDGFEYMDEKLLTRRIQWCVDSSSVFFIFGGIFYHFSKINWPKKAYVIYNPHHWMRLVESFSSIYSNPS